MKNIYKTPTQLNSVLLFKPNSPFYSYTGDPGPHPSSTHGRRLNHECSTRTQFWYRPLDHLRPLLDWTHKKKGINTSRDTSLDMGLLPDHKRRNRNPVDTGRIDEVGHGLGYREDNVVPEDYGEEGTVGDYR